MTTSPPNKLLIVTHEGKQHADELLACWILRTALDIPVEILRTDDPGTMSLASFVVDCGGIYDSAKGRYDHHGVATPNPPAHRKCGYSAAGLIWRDYGRKAVRVLLNGQPGEPWQATLAELSEDELKELVENLFYELDHDIVAPIDRWDLGMRARAQGLLPMQWLIPHLPFEAAMDALGYALSFRMASLLSYNLGARKLKTDLIANTGCRFWLFEDTHLVVVAEDEQRLDISAAFRFMEQIDDPDIQLLAVISPLKRGNKWTGIFTREIPTLLLDTSKFQCLKDHRTVFHSEWREILALGRHVATFELAMSKAP